MCRIQTIALLVALFVGLAQSWDIAITAGNRLEFYTEDGIKTDTVRFNNQNLYALAYNEGQNMLLYIDKQSENDTICGYDISYVEYKCYIERNGRNIQGLAYDPVTELMFFTDTKEKSINWFSFKSGSKNNVHGNLLIKLDVGIPTDIVVDSCRGFIYWINTDLTTSTIERARFNGSERKVVINAENIYDLHGLAIGQQTQKIYWDAPETYHKRHTFSADLNGKNIQSLIEWTAEPDDVMTFIHPNSLSVSKKYLYTVSWCSSCSSRSVWKLPKPTIKTDNYDKLVRVHTDSFIGIAANYKMKDQFQGISACNHFSSNDKTKDSIKIAREYESLFCVHGIKVIGESLCKCTPGYTGERCEVSVCENYCLQGNCSFTEEGFPKCSCEAGYSGKRCEVNVCNGYCLNNGTCSLNEKDEPVCDCVGKYEGEKCDVPTGLSNGDGSISEGNEPGCQFSGSHDDSIRKTNENKPISSVGYSAERNLTLAGLFANWRKPISKITVVVEA